MSTAICEHFGCRAEKVCLHYCQEHHLLICMANSRLRVGISDFHGLTVGLSAPEPAPQPSSGRPIWELVIQDMKERDQMGRARYGTPLQAFNGRSALRDAYQEVLDLAVYLRQLIEEEGRR